MLKEIKEKAIEMIKQEIQIYFKNLSGEFCDIVIAFL